jgi:hypothetical protein
MLAACGGTDQPKESADEFVARVDAGLRESIED